MRAGRSIYPGRDVLTLDSSDLSALDAELVAQLEDRAFHPVDVAAPIMTSP